MTQDEADALYHKLCEVIGWENLAAGGMNGPHDVEEDGGFYRMSFCVRVNPCEECLKDVAKSRA